MTLGILSRLFGGTPTDYKSLVKGGAVILDVRSPGEFSGGHIKGAKNIPLDQLRSKSSALPKDKAIICYCASGMRSASAKSLLKSQGFTDVHNGGGWMSLKRKLD